MNNLLDLDVMNDFVEECANGRVCPVKPIEIRNISGNKIMQRSFLDHAIMLCKNNNTNILSLLNAIDSKINHNMGIIGKNVPFVKDKINSIIKEWPNNYDNEISYDDIFKSKNNGNFNYSNLVDCNNSVLNLDSKMRNLEDLMKGNIHIGNDLNDLQSYCNQCDGQINDCNNNLESILENYNNNHSKILLDLSTIHKPSYLMEDRDDKLNNMNYQNNFRKIPDNFSEIILNSVLIPNMILKEIQYLKNILDKLKSKVNISKETILKLKDNLPSESLDELSFGPIKKFISSLIESEEEIEEKMEDKKTPEEMEKEREEKEIGSLNQKLSKMKDKKKFLVDTSDEENSEMGDPDTYLKSDMNRMMPTSKMPTNQIPDQNQKLVGEKLYIRGDERGEEIINSLPDTEDDMTESEMSVKSGYSGIEIPESEIPESEIPESEIPESEMGSISSDIQYQRENGNMVGGNYKLRLDNFF
jgi:hypothetical protein